MATSKKPPPFRLTLKESLRAEKLPRLVERKDARVRPAKPPIAPRTVLTALKKTPGAEAVIRQAPELTKLQLWQPVATFSVCQKTGTATFLDIWDSDHFDGFTDMQRCLTDCRAWFSANGYTFWDSAQTKSGRVNCYFRAPTTGLYVCNVQLQSHGGPATVECLVDNSSFGPLPFNGTINQPHTATLGTGFHHFRIRQMSGSFFFVSLTVWKI